MVPRTFGPGLRFAPSGLQALSRGNYPPYHNAAVLPDGSTSFGIAEMKSRAAISSLHGVVFDIFVGRSLLRGGDASIKAPDRRSAASTSSALGVGRDADAIADAARRVS
jgi:hypothetical protein